ncbi:MAG: CHASE domain-containing protein, partial [Spirochaetaceae bacterium]|nr:CHASE domain-containing protein [Spirochaetaceae bacterium]
MKANEQALCRSIATAASRTIAASLSDSVKLGETLGDALSRNPDLDKGQIAALSRQIMDSGPWVTGLTTAPGAVVKYHYPEEGNESLIGHDLLSNPDRRYALTLAAGLKAPVISGPYESVDDGRVFFIRYPVFHGEKLWGFTSATIDYDVWIKALDLEGTYPDISFAISRKPDEYSSAGDIKANAPGSIICEIPVQGGAIWQLHVKPTRGWTSFDPFLLILLVAGLLAAVFLFLILYQNNKRAAKAAPQAMAERPAHTLAAKNEPEARADYGAAGQEGHAALGQEKTSDASACPPEVRQKSAEGHRAFGVLGSARPAENMEQAPQPPERLSQQKPQRPPEEVISSENADLPRFRGQTVPGEIFMPESPVKGNFASLLMKVSEQESGFQEQPEPVAQPVTMQSAAAPVDEPIPVP